MSNEFLKKYLSSVAIKHFPKGSKIFSEGEESNGIMYFVFSGKLIVTKISGMGEELILRQIGPGEFFGELALIHRAPRAANVIAISDDTKVGIITKSVFLGMGNHSPGFLSVLLKSVIRRLTEVEEKVVERKEELHELINQTDDSVRPTAGVFTGTPAEESKDEEEALPEGVLPIPIDPSLTGGTPPEPT
ncbi:MAG: cyclic nucleotide-binding domain-containing protein [Leptospira sp.]|jgi:CRP/FNR family cyclic AMP-dependent transcriptional regulator|nr:cyclic nucleotide-binding domain-containing protein [Leptospira sp.]